MHSFDASSNPVLLATRYDDPTSKKASSKHKIVNEYSKKIIMEQLLEGVFASSRNGETRSNNNRLSWSFHRSFLLSICGLAVISNYSVFLQGSGIRGLEEEVQAGPMATFGAISLREEVLQLLKEQKEESSHLPQPPLNPPPHQQQLPSCQDLMSAPHSPYADGEILSRPTTTVNWVPRKDGSKELQLPHLCTLKRYTREEAKQCLAGHHLLWVGDSLTRYLWISLTYFLYRGVYPPHFGVKDRIPRFSGSCEHHTSEDGIETCSPPGHPNVCKESDFQRSWDGFHETVGDIKGPFEGHVDCHCSKSDVKMDGGDFFMDNMYYATSAKENDNSNAPNKEDLIEMSFYFEAGWNDSPTNLTNYRWQDCSLTGTCRRNATTKADITRRLKEKKVGDLDLNLRLEDALQSKELKRLAPNADVVLYNRGLWGELKEERAKRVMPLLHNFANDGRCFYRSTTSRSSKKGDNEHNGSGQAERERVRNAALGSGCGYLDYAHLTREFSYLPFAHPKPPTQKHGKIHSGFTEAGNVFRDAVHFQPWVFEELNNFMLNVLCNADGHAA